MILNVPEVLTYNIIKSYAKIYPDFTKIFMYHEPIKVKQKGWEENNKKHKSKKPKDEIQQLQSEITSIRRTRTRLKDIIISNKFEWFVTFTIKKDRQNIERSKNKMSYWLENAQRRYGAFEYVIVSEFHKDGVSLHFHALIKGYKGEMRDSGVIQKGRKVYNVVGFKSGFTNAKKIDPEGYEKVSSYITKYIQKDMPMFSNKRRYWCSQKLTRPKKIENPVITSEQMRSHTDCYINNRFTVYTLENLENNRS